MKWKRFFLIFLSGSFLFFTLFVNAQESEKKLKRLDLADSALQSAESSNDAEEYKRIKPLEKEPPLVIKSSGYFEEPEFIPEPEIIKEGQEKTEEGEPKEEVKYDTSVLGKKLVSLAEKWMNSGTKSVNINGKNVSVYNDCSNFVRAIYWNITGKDIFYEAQVSGATSEEKTNMSSGCALLYAYFKRKQHYSPKMPRKGDVIFFDNTYDCNNNRRIDDPLTHVGIVTDIDKGDGTVTFIHANTGRPKSIYKAYLNLKYPDQQKLNGKIINTYLKRKYTWETGNLQFSGQLTRGFGGF